jgi:hypothetical protein
VAACYPSAAHTHICSSLGISCRVGLTCPPQLRGRAERSAKEPEAWATPRLPLPSRPTLENPQLRQAVSHAQNRFGVVDVNARRKSECRDGRGKHIDEPKRRVPVHQVLLSAHSDCLSR